MNTLRHRLCQTAWYGAVFLFFFLWFTQVKRLVVFDMDDWTYLGYVRSATPVWGEWNPAKVFPEVVMPFFSMLGRYLVMPLTGDFITAMTVTHAAVVSGFICLYLWCFSGLVQRMFRLSGIAVGCLGVLFLTLHFLIFRTGFANNTYLFHASDLNCYYNYTLPSLLGASLVMALWKNPKMDAFLRQGSLGKRGLLYLVIYLAIFSNLASTGILAAFSGGCILISLGQIRKSRKLLPLLRENGLHLGILAAWLVSAIFELGGGRAGSFTGGSLIKNLRLSLYYYRKALAGANGLFWAVSAGLFLAALAVLVYRRARKQQDDAEQNLGSWFPVWLAAFAAVQVYIVALCGAVSISYITRSEYLLAPLCYILLAVCLAAGYLLHRFPRLELVLPVLLLFLVSQVNTRDKTFLEPNMSNLDGRVCTQISQDVCRQVLDADAAGQSQVVLSFPMFTAHPEQEDNWPFSLSLLQRIPENLYELGLIRQPMGVIPNPTPAYNQKYHLPVPEAE